MENPVVDETLVPDEQNNEKLANFGVDLLHVIKEAQSQHGLRHGDYQRYHGYCNRRIKRLRKVLGFKMGEKKRVTPKVINEAMMSDSRYILLIVMAIERAWSFAMQLKQKASDSDTRKRHHMIQRMKKANIQAEQLSNLCEKSPIVDARTKLEAKAYASYIIGIYRFECQDWSAAMELFGEAKTIYGKLCETKSKDERLIYEQMIDDISPNIRYCAYNIGDQSAMNDLLQMRSSHKQDVLLADKLDLLVIQAKEQKATSMSEIKWKKHSIPVKSNKVRVFLISLKTFEKEILSENITREESLEMYESILSECKEALQCCREDIGLEKNTNKSTVSDLDLLYSHLNHTSVMLTIKRNLMMAEDLEFKSPARLAVLKRDAINENLMLSPKSNVTSKKVKLSDFIRLYDIILQNLSDIPTLKGLSEDLDLKDATAAQEQAFRALKCFYVAEAYGEQAKWKETMALYEKVLVHARHAIDRLRALDNVPEENFITIDQLESLVETIAFNKYHVHASAVMQASEMESKSEKDDESKMLSENEFLVDNLDAYFDSSSILTQSSTTNVKGAESSPKLTSHFPPAFVPVPNKPLFFDLALNHVSFPSLDDKISSKAKAGQGISGYIKSFWGWGGKKN